MIRRREEIAKMRKAGLVVAEMLERICAKAKPGVTTAKLDRIARDVIEQRGAVSNFLGYRGYPAVICASPNDVIVHGIPGRTMLEEGDILSIDCGAIVEGYHGDAARTVAVGSVSKDAQRLMDTTRQALDAGIARMLAGVNLYEVGRAVQKVAEKAGFSVVREYVGHAIGTEMHEDPQVPNYWPGRPGPKLAPGMAFAIEPMVNAGGAETELLDDGWTVVTADGSLSAHFEDTVVVTEGAPEILTRVA